MRFSMKRITRIYLYMFMALLTVILSATWAVLGWVLGTILLINGKILPGIVMLLVWLGSLVFITNEFDSK